MKTIIMAGGKGTRMAGVLKDVPKPMARIAGKPILEHQIEVLKKQGLKEIILIVGYLGEVIKEHFGNGSRFGVEIEYIDEKEPLGTAGALYYLKGRIGRATLLLFGDIFFDIDLERFVKFHLENNSDITLLTHPNSHPYDSDLVVADEKGRVLRLDSKHNVRDYDYENNVNAGLYVVSDTALEFILEPKKTDMEKNLIADMLSQNARVFAYQSSEYVKDAGTPDRFISVETAYKKGIVQAKNLANRQKSIFLDRDGTINVYKDFITDKEQIELIEGAAEAIKKINESEYLAVIVTNQPVIARGESSYQNLDLIHKRLKTLLGRQGCFVDALYFCPHHPHSGYDGEVKELKIDCDCRKPKSGMLLRASKEFNIDLQNSYIIGDTQNDVDAGVNAGVKPIKINTNEPNALLNAVSKILC